VKDPISNANLSSLFIKDADRIDSATWEPGVGIKGQSWHVDVSISGSLDDNGFIYDFSLLKKSVKTALKETLDHALLIPKNSAEISISHKDGRVMVREGGLSFDGPSQSVYLLPCDRVDTACIEAEFNKILKARLPDRVLLVQTTLREENCSEGEFFHYTHGITGHEGRCQRLFHGHRSLVEVFVNRQKRRDLEKILAESLFKGSIHFADESQISSIENGFVNVEYAATEGLFKGSIPQSQVFMIDKGTSIETLVEFFASSLEKDIAKGDLLEVFGYEGIGKGAVASREIQP
jgi:6-pyruvoyl-tetrahydropterin synthase